MLTNLRGLRLCRARQKPITNSWRYSMWITTPATRRSHQVTFALRLSWREASEQVRVGWNLGSHCWYPTSVTRCMSEYYALVLSRREAPEQGGVGWNIGAHSGSQTSGRRCLTAMS